MSKDEERVHARLSGSTAYRWMNCKGSISLIETLPSETPGPAALRGTELHAVNDVVLKNFLDYKITGVKTPYDFKGDEEAKEVSEKWVNAVWEKALEQSLTGKAWGIEDKFTLNHHLQMFGYIDFWAVYISDQAKRTAIIIDFKSGHHTVPAKKNAQLAFYGAALRAEMKAAGKDIDVVRCAIYQPKDEAEPYKEVRYTAKQMDNWEKKFIQAANQILVTQRAPFKVGDWCHFCPAKAICKHYAETLSATAALQLINPDKVVLPAPETLPDETLFRLVMKGDEIIDYIKAVNAFVVGRHQRGQPIQGLKVVKSTPRRKWNDNEEEIGEALKTLGVEDPFQKKLKPLTAIEKIVGKESLRTFVGQTVSSLILVEEADPRPAIENAQNILGELT